jgi:hypothetical protein
VPFRLDRIRKDQTLVRCTTQCCGVFQPQSGGRAITGVLKSP